MGIQMFLRLALLSILLNSRLFVVAESEGDNFSNNLFTDLAPLLGLFGEQFAKQFLSESSSIAELILFAMAPLGVLTALVGAIRVGGASWLKRLIGRARENFADVEMELMSSVSKEVCELWDGRSIVRSRGNPQVRQIIHVPAEDGDISPESFITMDQATWSRKNNKYQLLSGDEKGKHTMSEISSIESHIGSSKPLSGNVDGNNKNLKADIEAQTPQVTGHFNGDSNGDNGPRSNSRPNTPEPKDMAADEYTGLPPNISLNIHGGSNAIEVWVSAAFATALQVGVLVWSWQAKKYKLIALKSMVGFWLQMIGTVVLTFSLIACAGIIDHGSREQRWSRHGRDLQLYWLQKQHTAGDNNFDPYILYAKESTDHVFESHRATESRQINHKREPNKEPMKKPLLRRSARFSVQLLTTVAVVTGVLGFVAQFQGLRFSNWSCSVAQLIALAAATFLRAMVRRNMTKTPGAVPVDNNYLLDHLTVAMISRGPNGPNGSNDFKSSVSGAFHSPGLLFAFGVQTIPQLRAIPDLENDASPPGAKPEGLSSGSQPSVSGQRSKEASNGPNLAQQALNLRVRLGQITKWTGAYREEAIMLSDSIETALKRLHPRIPEDRKWTVVFPINTCRHQPDALPTRSSTVQEEVELFIMKDGDEWKVDDAQLEALLSLASYSAWVTKQIRGNRIAREAKESSSALESSENRTKRPIGKDHQSIGWLRTKALESPSYDTIIGKSSPRLVLDLSWWIGDVEQVFFREVKVVHEINQGSIFVPPKGSSSDREANYDKVINSLTLGFYANDETSQESNIFLSSKCTERQAFILHLFSAFIWAITEYVSVQEFHPAYVIESHASEMDSPLEYSSLVRNGANWTRGWDHQLKSDKLENLVQELQGAGLSTFAHIYQVLIPPLSHFDKLPNEAMADWRDESLIVGEECMFTNKTFKGYKQLIKAVQHREIEDRFANRTAAIIVGFLFRIHEDSMAWSLSDNEWYFEEFNKDLRKFMVNENKTFSNSILSIRPILKRQGKLKKIDQILLRLDLEDLGLGIPPSADASEEPNFTFPSSTDVFGWSKEYWSAFAGDFVNKYSYKTLDLAGQSVLHNAIDGLEDDIVTGLERFSVVVRRYRSRELFQDRELLTAKCDKQTPLHRAARTGLTEVFIGLVGVGLDPNAVDFFGRTALCFAAHQGNSEIINMLCDRMKASLDHKDYNRHNALVHAILNHQEDAAVNLIRRKIQINGRDSEDRTPLWYAAGRGMEKVVEALLKENHIEVHNKGYNEQKYRLFSTPKKEAEFNGHKKIVEMIEEWEKKKEKPSETKSEDEQNKGKSSTKSGSTADGLLMDKEEEGEEEPAEEKRRRSRRRRKNKKQMKKKKKNRSIPTNK